jgi:hypothetical protein
MKQSVVATLVAGLLWAAPSVMAHHGLAQFDTTHVVSMQGTVTDFQLINPHAVIHADLKDEHGKVQNWLLECGSPAMLGRHGWTSESLKRGDQVTVFGFRAKDGSPYMSLGRIELPGGKSLPGAP